VSRQCAGCFKVAGTAGAAILNPRVGLDVDDERIFEEITLPAIVVSEIDVEEVGANSLALGEGAVEYIVQAVRLEKTSRGDAIDPGFARCARIEACCRGFGRGSCGVGGHRAV